MRDDYLWDRSGEPDPEIERLEKLMARYRASDAAQPRVRRRQWRAAAAVAASLLVAVSAALLVTARPALDTRSAWELEINGAGTRPLHVGETIDTGRTAEARLAASAVGEVRLERESRLKLVRSNDRQERMALTRGTLHALIWAPPQKFVVDTPSATTVDLGCEYELKVTDDGSGLLTVSRGWVAFQAGDLESFIPAGAACRTSRRAGPGIPYFTDAPPPFRAAIAAFENTGGREGLATLLGEARDRDALTLWHLLRRARASERARVASRLAPMLPGADPVRLARLDPAAVESAWNALGLGDAGWWRTWKRKW